jgi:hypothetical protein
MTEKRNGCHVCVTWLTQLMSGKVQCQWATWFRSHCMGYPESISDHQQNILIEARNRCLDGLCNEFTQQSLIFFKEKENNFTANRGNMTIEGKPDLIVLGSNNTCTVYDIKIGHHEVNDDIQVMLYMAFLPYCRSGIYKGKTLNGCIVYEDGRKTVVPSHAINDNFRTQITHFLNILDASNEPKKVPSYLECLLLPVIIQ